MPKPDGPDMIDFVSEDSDPLPALRPEKKQNDTDWDSDNDDRTCFANERVCDDDDYYNCWRRPILQLPDWTPVVPRFCLIRPSFLEWRLAMK